MDPKGQLQKLIQDAKTKKFREGEAKGLMSEIQKEQTKILVPLLQEISRQGTERMVSAFENAIQSLKIEVPEINIPPISLPAINVPPFPRIPAPIVNYTPPVIKIPDIKMPGEMEIKGWVNFQGYDRGFLLNPLPVQLRDARGNPIDLLENLTKILAGGKASGGIMTQPLNNGGGKADFFTIKAFSQSAFSEITNPDGRVKVELPTGSSGLTDAELRAAHLDVQQVSGSIDSVKVTGFDTSVAAVITDSTGVQYSGSNPLPVTVVSGGSATSATNIVDSSGVGYSGSNPVPVTIISDAINLDQTTDSIAVRQVSGFVSSVYANNPVDNGDAATALRVVIAGNSSSSVNVVNANSLDVQIVSGGVVSTNNLQTASNPTVVGSGYQDNALRVVMATDSIVSVNVVSDAINLDQTTDSIAVRQVSGFVDSVYVNNPVDNGDSATALRVVIAGNSSSSVNVTNASLAATTVDSSGVAYSGSNPFPVTIVTSQTATVNTAITDSGGVQYSGSNPVPVTLISGGLTSTLSVGDSAARSADNGGNPVKVGGISRQTNPTAFADGDRSNFSSDDLGRQIVRPVQVRDLIVTAYATFATGTEATLLAGVAATFLDLIYILASNNSTAAIGIDIRPSTAGSIVMHLEIPANGTVGVAAPVPIPQQATGDGTGGTWTVDLPDVTGTTVSVSGLFTKEI